jgi:hypothetical protein
MKNLNIQIKALIIIAIAVITLFTYMFSVYGFQSF